MGKVKLKKKKGQMLLINKLGRFERLNQEEEKILVNRAVGGLAAVQLLPGRKNLTLLVDTTGWVPLSEHLRWGMDAETALSFIWSTARIAYDCERFGLRIDKLCWDPARVYTDAAGTVIMIYWPVTTLEQTAGDPLGFYHGFCQILGEGGMDRGALEQYRQYFYQRSFFDFQRFYQLVSSLVEQWRRSRHAKKQEDRQRREEEAIRAQRSDRLQRLSGVWLEDARTQEKLPLDTRQSRIGRDPGQSDVVISGYEGISRRHAVISSDGSGQFYVTDLGSRNGTYVQEQRIEAYQQILLRDHTPIRFGNACYVFRKTDLKQTVSIHQLLQL